MDENATSSQVRLLSDQIAGLMKKSGAERAWDMAFKIAVPVAIAAGSMVIGHEMRLGQIETTRFTREDAAKLESRIRQEGPPEWLKAQLSELKAILREQEVRMRAIEQKIAK